MAIPASSTLVERATAALPDVNVYDGFGIPGDLDEDALMVGGRPVGICSSQ